MKIAIPYGKSSVSITVTDNATVLKPEHSDPLENPEESAERAFRNPIGTDSLADIYSPEETMAIVTSDITRPAPNREMVSWILKELDPDPEKVTIIIGTGSHRSCTDSEIESMFGQDIVKNYRIINHNAFDKDTLIKTGTDAKGNEIFLNKKYCEAGFRIVTGFIEPHFFAGFSGGPKGIIPGIAGIDTIMPFHNAKMIAHPKATWGILEGNPLQEMARQGLVTAPPHFAVNVTLNGKKEITGIYCGHYLEAHKKGSAMVKNETMIQCQKPFDIVITSNSGYPLDQNLYQAVKGISAASSIIKEGGDIICVAQCSDGIPDHGNFKTIMSMKKSAEEVHRMIMEDSFSMYDQWQAQKLTSILTKCKVYLYSSLEDEIISSMHLHPCNTVEETLKELTDIRTGASIAVLPNGPMSIPYIK